MTSATSLTQSIVIGPVNPEIVFLMLTDPDITPSFFNRSSFRCEKIAPGAPYALVAGETVIADGEILAYEPFQTLGFTFAQRYDASITDAPGRVSITVAQRVPLCQVTIVHEGLTPDSPLNADLDDSWLLVASGLKTVIETNRTLPLTREDAEAILAGAAAEPEPAAALS